MTILRKKKKGDVIRLKLPQVGIRAVRKTLLREYLQLSSLSQYWHGKIFLRGREGVSQAEQN